MCTVSRRPHGVVALRAKGDDPVLPGPAQKLVDRSRDSVFVAAAGVHLVVPTVTAIERDVVGPVCVVRDSKPGLRGPFVVSSTPNTGKRRPSREAVRGLCIREAGSCSRTGKGRSRREPGRAGHQVARRRGGASSSRAVRLRRAAAQSHASVGAHRELRESELAGFLESARRGRLR